MIPNKPELLKRLHNTKIDSKFDIKLGLWQVQIREQYKYKITFTISFGYYE